MIKTLKSIALIGAVLTVTATNALAVEVKKEVIVGADVATTWKKIGGWCALSNWHPAVEKCEETKEGKNIRRKLTLGGGGIIIERFTSNTDQSYSYVIEESPLPIANYAATIAVAAEGKKTKITWSSKFDAKGKTDKEAATIIEGIYVSGFDALQKDLGK